MGEGRSCKCDLTINITFSKTAISCFPRRLERSVSLEESLRGHVSSCAFKKLEVESRGGSSRRELSRAKLSQIYMCVPLLGTCSAHVSFRVCVHYMS